MERNDKLTCCVRAGDECDEEELGGGGGGGGSGPSLKETKTGEEDEKS